MWITGRVLMSWFLFDFCLSSSNHLQPDMNVDEDPLCPASEDTPAVGNSPLAATRGVHLSSETKPNTEFVEATPPAGPSVGPSRTAPVEVVTQGGVLEVIRFRGVSHVPDRRSKRVKRLLVLLVFKSHLAASLRASLLSEKVRYQQQVVGVALASVPPTAVLTPLVGWRRQHQGATPLQSRLRALERAQEIISTIGVRPTVTGQGFKEVEPPGSSKEAGSSLADQPLDRFERYADGAERADRLATAQAQKRMDELLEGPGTATGRRKAVSKETGRGHKSPMKPPVSVPIGGQSGNSRFERLYAEGAERKARRKDLERSIVEEEDAKLKEAMAKARLATRSTSGGEGSVVGGSSGLWERMSKQEADTRAMRLQ
ncbi:hypothetical protein FOZ62_026400, partial [Perkinsus olseni]